MEKKKVYYVMEYMENSLSDWSYNEILQMQKYLSRHPHNNLIITNFDVIKPNADTENVTNIENLNKFISEQKEQKIVIVSKRLIEYLNEEKGFVSIPVEGGQPIEVSADKICLLDLRAEHTLAPKDNGEFEMFVFGGILGDHPPRDRTFALRKDFLRTRNLKTKQMSTDTAILVSDIILNDGYEIDQIPMIEDPELRNTEDPSLSVVMTGFTYVSNKFDLKTGKINPEIKEEVPIMNSFIRDFLVFIDFDFQF